jgi:diguanylate cyclase (GGDEF)-like protein
LTVLLGDVKNFKHVNDTLGHVRGDECLKHVAMRIEQAARANEECFRWGGDEFAVVLPDTRADEATVVRERICGDMGDDCGPRLELTCAVASLADGAGPDDLLEEVDRVLVGLKVEERERSAAEGSGQPA